MVQKLEDTIIDNYHITQLLARGGMAKIYLAEDTRTGEHVAIKVVHNNDENYYQRFRREVRAIANLRHEHILPALDWGDYGSWSYMVMPYIQYGTLIDRILDGPLSLEEVGEILTQLAAALHYAHEHGIVHRDIKPSNVLMRDKHYAYLADFGLVKDTGTDHSLTQSGYLIGTPEYIAPEMLEGPATPVSDTYALGILLYQMLTGRLPFTGATPVAIMWKHVQERPVPPSRLNPAIPPAIDQVVMKALEKKPGRRFQSARALQQAYQNALTSQESIWQHLDTSIRHLKSTTKQSLRPLLQSGMIPAYLTSLTQHHTISTVNIQNMPTCARAVANIKQHFTTEVRPATLSGLSIILLLTLSLSVLSFSAFSSHPTPIQQTNHSTIQHQSKIPMKLSIVITLPPIRHPSTARPVDKPPALKPSLVLKNQYTYHYNDTNNNKGDGSKYNHGHSHDKHDDD